MLVRKFFNDETKNDIKYSAQDFINENKDRSVNAITNLTKK